MAETEHQLPSREEYDKFIQGLELSGVRVVEAHTKTNVRHMDSTETGVSIELGFGYEPLSEDHKHFEVYANLKARFVHRKTEETQGVVEVTLGLAYASDVPINDGIFEVFSNVNVPLNAWPYLREYVHQTLLRFGWPPFVLPPYKTTSPKQEKLGPKRKSKASKSSTS